MMDRSQGRNVLLCHVNSIWVYRFGLWALKSFMWILVFLCKFNTLEMYNLVGQSAYILAGQVFGWDCGKWYQ